jgi:hypothetical protein
MGSELLSKITMDDKQGRFTSVKILQSKPSQLLAPGTQPSSTKLIVAMEGGILRQYEINSQTLEL